MLGQAAGKVAMSSTKSAIGHLLGAAGAVEAAFTVLAMRDQIAPPTINLDNPSVETPIDLVPNKAKPMKIEIALSNSFGFGGTNASRRLQEGRRERPVDARPVAARTRRASGPRLAGHLLAAVATVLVADRGRSA